MLGIYKAIEGKSTQSFGGVTSVINPTIFRGRIGVKVGRAYTALIQNLAIAI